MLFHSQIFICFFLPVTLIGCFIMESFGTRRLVMGWLLAASMLFYGWWNLRYLMLLLGSILFNYSLGFLLGDPRQPPRRRRAGLWVGITGNLAVLAFFKYANFFIANVNAAFSLSLPLQRIVLPLAISFFTFQQIGYLVDCAAGRAGERDLLRYSLFVSFFPQLIAGPIVRYGEVAPQMARAETYRFRWANLAAGLTMFAFGLVKKVVMADSLAGYADLAFNAAAAGHALTWLEAWFGVLAYTLQLYFDFSGYSDMALGAARMVGLQLPINFNSPYQASSIIEFWQRWHMTLSRFFRDYLFLPLGRRLHGSVSRYLNVMIVMLLVGLWHGASWAFVFWGALHGGYLVVNYLWRVRRPPLDTGGGISPSRLAARAATFLAVVIGWVFFRAPTWSAAMIVLKGLWGGAGVALPQTYAPVMGPLGRWFAAAGGQFGLLPAFSGMREFAWILGLLLVVWICPNTQEVIRLLPARSVPSSASSREGKRRPIRWAPAVPWTTVAGGLMVALLILVLAAAHLSSMSPPKSTQFVYFQF